MGRACAVCSHPDREDIERALVGGTALRAVAATFGISKDAARRHLNNHVSAALVRTERRARQDDDDDRVSLTVRDRLEELATEARHILDTAKADGNAGLSLQAIDRIERILDKVARISGELDERPQVLNLVADPEWLRLRASILSALERHPAALDDVLAALGAVDGPRALEAG